MPCFTSGYEYYDSNFVEHFLELGLPRIAAPHMELIRNRNACKLANADCKKCESTNKVAEKDITAFITDGYEPRTHEPCSNCLSTAYKMGLSKESLLKTNMPNYTLCAIKDVFASRNLEAAFQTNCPTVKEALSLFASTPEIANPVEAIVEGLKVKYTTDLDLERYLELLDGKTTRAVREVTKKIMEDPFASKYSERLNSKIFEFNREVEEVGKSRTAKFYHAVSDIAVYGGSKFIERRARGYLHLGKKDMHKLSEWIASKLMDVHAKATGKDWTIAQLYRTRWKIEQCKKQTESNK